LTVETERGEFTTGFSTDNPSMHGYSVYLSKLLRASSE
jgi:hypothetical protein